jgi:hypothetical protein
MQKAFFLAVAFAAAASVTSHANDASLDGKRKEAIERKRAVLYYDGGDEIFRWSKKTPFSIDAFLKWHIAPLKDSEVDTVVYCPVSAFAYGSANVPSMDLLLAQPDSSQWMDGNTNVLQHFIDAKTDPLKEVVKWCKANNKEVFAALSVNSTHHGSEYDFAKPPPPYSWYNYLVPPFKLKNTNFLLGAPSGKSKGQPDLTNPPFASRFGLDYGEAAVRDKYFEMARDLCANYDIDGLLIDFMRDPQLFRSTAWGDKASPNDRKAMTELIQRIRKSAEETGVQRGRPVLIVVRVPDSLPYCKDIGIDLEAWLAGKMVDLVIGGGGFQLNPWTYMTALCKKAGVKFYASLDESGIWIGNDRGGGEDDRLLPRQSAEAYRARTTEALTGGADGVFFISLHNESNISSDWMRASPKSLQAKNKRYFVTYRNVGRAGNHLKEGKKYLALPELCVYRPAEVKSGGTSGEYPISVWENQGELKTIGKTPAFTLVSQAVVPQGMQLEAYLNKRKLELVRNASGYQTFAVPPELVKFGENRASFRATGKSDKKFHSSNAVSVKNLAVNVTFE